MLIYSYRGFSPWLLGPIASFVKTAYHGREHVVEQSHSPHGGDEKERKRKKLGSHNPPGGNALNELNLALVFTSFLF
jgi:hypothetical protein